MKIFRKLRFDLVEQNKIGKYLKYAIGEIILVVIGILIAFQLNNWNDSRIKNNIEEKILSEILNGLNEDLVDIKHNIDGHNTGIKACDFWRKTITDQDINTDSVAYNYHYLTRDFISIQNISGYESLKSKGLELIKVDSLRIGIIKLYEQDYNSIRKLEEEYKELQFQESYFKEINHILSPNLLFDEEGELIALKLPIVLNEIQQKTMLTYLWKIKKNRQFILTQYYMNEKRIKSLKSNIESEITKE